MQNRVTFNSANNMEKDKITACAEKAAYAIVCKMIDCGYVESEPEGLDWEHEISEIIKEKFGC